MTINSFVLLSIVSIYAHKANAQVPSAKVNAECDIQIDKLLIEDGDAAGTGLSYLKCRPTGAGSKGFWQRKLCPVNKRFDYVNQICAIQLSNSVDERKTVVAPGSSCRQGETCGGNSFCNNFVGVCMCPENTQDRAGICVLLEQEKVEIGQKCDLLRGCNGGSVCIESYCQCSKPLVQKGDQCVQDQGIQPIDVGAGESCATGEVCIGGSVCNPFAKKCMCPVGTVRQGNQCIQKTLVGVEGGKVGEDCKLNTDCMIGAYCNPNTKPSSCQCLSTHVDVEGMCYRVIRPGQDGCEHDMQCDAAYGGATCHNRFCVCPDGTDSMGQTCREKKDMAFPGDPCIHPNSSSICIGGSLCINGFCLCPNGLTSFQKQCVHNNSILLPLGASCFQGMHCDANSECINGICLCPPNMEPRGNRCMSKMHRIRLDANLQEINNEAIFAEDLLGVPLGFFCLPDQLTCSGGNGSCIDGLCQCPTGFLAINGSCLSQLVSLDQPCSTEKGQTCSGGSECKLSFCRCPTGTGNSAGQCTILNNVRAGFGQFCMSNEVCAGNSFCINSTCQCPDEWKYIDGKCKNVQYSSVGNRCTPFESCSGGAKCVNNYCICTDGSYQSNGLCAQYPGGSCSAGQVCAGGSSCQFGICRCPGGKQSINNRCEGNKDPGPGDSCQEGQTCNGESECVFGVCLCPADFIAVGKLCQRKDQTANPGEDCSRGQQCQGNSYCYNGICICPNNAPAVNHQCPGNTALPGQSCQQGQVCVGNSICTNSFCQCPSPTVIDGQQCIDPRVPSPGQACTTGQKCRRNALCTRGLCRCQSGQTIDSNNNICRTTTVPAFPGQICSGTQKKDCIGESFCLYNVCQCNPGQTIINNECSTSPPNIAYPGMSCANGEKCVSGSSCQSNYCICPAGYVDVNRKCQRVIPQKRPGDVCLGTDTCGSGLRCVNGFCTCPVGQTPVNYVCTTNNPGPGERCSGKQACNGGSACYQNVCECPTDYLILSKQCRLARIPPGHTCIPGQQCTGYSLCQNSICQCQQNQIAIDGVCQTRRVGPGESCRSGERCTGGSICMSPQQICQCATGVPVNGQCPTKTKPGDNCIQSIQCVDNAVCQNNICICQTGYLNFNGKCVRFPTADPGQSCQQGEICLGGSSCEEKMCTCPLGYIITNNKCVQTSNRANPGESCARGQQCQGRSYCLRNTCTCPTNTVRVGTICQYARTAYPGQSCANGQQCLGGSYCISSTCRCPDNTVQVGVQCQGRTAKPGQACNTGVHCTGGSKCLNNVCQCPSGYFIYNEQCSKNFQPRPGERCTTGQTCSGGASCSAGICSCRLGSTIINFQCVAAVGPGGNCGQGQQCTGGSFCQNGYCVCPFGSSAINGLCQTIGRTSPPGGPCGSDGVQCTVNSFCAVTKICICNSGTVQLGNQCKYISAPGESCAGDRVCTGGSSCVNSLCQCPGTLVLRNKQCISERQTSKPGEPCSISQLCTGNAICQSGICRCRMGEIQSGYQCVKGSFPNEPCNAGEVCMGGSQCDGRTCLCPIGTVAANDYCYPSTSVAYPGGSCFHGELCVANSVCRYSACVCPPGSNPVNSECRLPTTNVYPGGACTYSYQCQLGLTCMFGICQCTQFSGPNCPGAGKSTSPPGGSCAAMQQCVGGSSCRDGWCICPDPNMVVTRGMCTVPAGNGGAPINLPLTPMTKSQIKKASPGEFCGDDVQCIGGSSCTAGQCLCPIGTAIVDNECKSQPEPSFKSIKRLMPNDPCSETGKLCEGGAVCDGILCKCPPGTEVRDNSCMAPIVAGPGNSCANGEQCTGGSGCEPQHKLCTCPNGLNKVVNGQCTAEEIKPSQPKVALPNSPCDFGVQCIGGSTCDPGSQLCQCPENSVAVNGICQVVQTTTQAIAAAGELCDPENTQCTGGSSCNWATGICECPNTYEIVDGTCEKSQPIVVTTTTPTPTPAAALDRINTRTICTSDLDCSADRVCINTFCICKPGYIAINGQCQAVQGDIVPIGQICVPEEQCQGQSKCINNICRCPQGTTPDTSANCISSISQTPPHVTQTTLSPPPQLGQSCTIGQFCGPRAECREGRCKCMAGFIKENFECIATVDPRAFSSPGDPCTSGQDCTGGSICNFGYCICPIGTESINMQCVKQQPHQLNPGFSSPGHSCRRGQQCTGRSYCVNGVCTCPAGMKNSNGACSGEPLPPVNRQPANAGEKCEPGQACLGGSICINNVCKCPEKTKAQNGVCVTIVQSTGFNFFLNEALTNICTADIECFIEEWCVNNTCNCMPRYVRIGKICMPETPKPTTRMLSIAKLEITQPTSVVTATVTAEPEVPMVPTGATLLTAQPKFVAPVTSTITILTEKPKFVAVVAPSTTVDTEKSEFVAAVAPHTTLQTEKPFIAVTTPRATVRPAKSSFVATRIRPSKMRTAKPGEACANKELCTGGSICDSDDQTCKCAPKHEIIRGMCIRIDSNIVGPGHSCTNGKECGRGSLCNIDGFCRCTQSHYNIEGLCMPKTDIDGAAKEQPKVPDINVRNRMPSMPVPAIQVQPTRAPRVRSKSNAQRCPLPENTAACQLPYCFCSRTGREIPGGLKASETPQFVVMTFDDAVNGKNIDIYKDLFDGNLKNMNGCPMKATFYVSHEWTNYDGVQWLASQGHEVASNSITHRPMRRKSFARWMADMEGQRRMMTKFANVYPNDIIGMRAPQLSVGGNTQFKMMQQMGFKYDNSISANPGRTSEPFWPQTLDYEMPWDCQNEQCPTGSFPGIWEFPVNQFYGYFLPRISNYKRSSMIRAALSLNETGQSALNMLRSNFKRAYETNKAPYIMTLNADFLYLLEDRASIKALKTFIKEMQQYNDVWFVTMAQLLEWIRSPLTNNQMQKFGWCRPSKTPPPCNKANKCMYKTPKHMSSEHQFFTCNACPRMYPWIDNPLGE